MAESFENFEDAKQRLYDIVDQVNAEGVTMEEALSLYEEAVKIGLAACDLSELDIDPQASAEEVEGEEAAPSEAAENTEEASA